MPGENLTWAFAVLASGLTLCDLCSCPGQADFTTPVLCSNGPSQPHLAPLSWKRIWLTLPAATLLMPTFTVMVFPLPLCPLLPPLTYPSFHPSLLL